MKITIKNRFTNEVILEGEAENIKEFLEKNREADLAGAYLGGANLTGADLTGADLTGADLKGADIRGAKIKINQKNDMLKALKVKIVE